MTQEQAEVVAGRITGTLTYDDFKRVDMVIEAAIEVCRLSISSGIEIPHVGFPPNSIPHLSSHTTAPHIHLNWHPAMHNRNKSIMHASYIDYHETVL